MDTPHLNTRCKVGVARSFDTGYPGAWPFHPETQYPEYPFGGHISASPNGVYDAVRRTLCSLGLDDQNRGTSGWNPLGSLIKPGMTVAIKPNFVLSRHSAGKDVFSIITHPSVLRAVIDYCWIALRGEGKIIVADSPQYDCDFDELLRVTRLEEVCNFYSSFPGPDVEVRDLRYYWSKNRHFPSMIKSLPGDPEGVVRVNLREKSAFHGHPRPERYYGAVYHRCEAIVHHSGDRQEYQVSGTILGADAVVSVPKMKVHKKVGVTLNAKGLVGICTNKNLCIHYTLGSPSEGGDQFPDGLFTPMERALIAVERWMYDHLLSPRMLPLEYVHRSLYWLHGTFIKPLGIKVAKEKRLFDAGNWYGNDSAWRTVSDLVKIIYFSDRSGTLRDSPQRRLFSVVDGIVGGESNGPLAPDPKAVGVIAAGDNLLAVDLVVTRLMGFDYRKMKLFSVLQDPAFNFGLTGPEDVNVSSDDDTVLTCLAGSANNCLAFRPHPGWAGHIEI